MTRIYVCGPMTGLPEFNYPAFAAETARLRALGYEVVSPAEINPNGGTWQECMKKDIAQLMTCELLVWLPGWSNSRGARIETSLARELEINTVMASSITEHCAEAA
ncbi:MAG: DUF4406 domain-containing protein [Janthinobacterium lividum]